MRLGYAMSRAYKLLDICAVFTIFRILVKYGYLDSTTTAAAAII